MRLQANRLRVYNQPNLTLLISRHSANAKRLECVRFTAAFGKPTMVALHCDWRILNNGPKAIPSPSGEG